LLKSRCNIQPILFSIIKRRSKTTFTLAKKWIFRNIESESRINIDIVNTYKHQINITATHRFDSDIQLPYGPVCRATNESIQRMLSNVVVTKTVMSKIKAKTKLIAWFVSNCKTQSRREDYVAELKRYVPVDIYGKCGDLKCNHSAYRSCEAMINKKYKFYLAFENSLCRDYITEKLFKINSLDIVAIVMGGADYSRYVPPGTYIDVRDFRMVKDLADYLLVLDSKPELYTQYLLRKRAMTCKRISNEPFICRLCSYLHAHKHQEQRIDLEDFWSESKNCQTVKEFRNYTRWRELTKNRN